MDSGEKDVAVMALRQALTEYLTCDDLAEQVARINEVRELIAEVSPFKVAEMRRLRDEYQMSLGELAIAYGVARSTVTRALKT